MPMKSLSPGHAYRGRLWASFASRKLRVRACGTLLLLAVAVMGCGAQSGELIQGFDVSNASIPGEEIRSGGPGKDGIPTIDQPVMIRTDKVDFMSPDDLVVTVSIGTDHRAYPLRILVWHEIVNDIIGGQPVAVTYCPLCGTAMVFDRRVGDRTLNFGVSGLLYQSDVLMYDRQTESLWSQLGMKAVAGKMLDTPLTWIPSEVMTWQMWWAKGGGSLTLSTNTGHFRDYNSSPYRDYETNSKTMFPVPQHRTDLKNKAWILGVVINGEAKAYPREALEKLTISQTIKDRVGGEEIVVAYRPDTQHATVTNETRGQSQPHVMAYWFAWQAFYPQTALWRTP